MDDCEEKVTRALLIEDLAREHRRAAKRLEELNVVLASVRRPGSCEEIAKHFFVTASAPERTHDMRLLKDYYVSRNTLKTVNEFTVCVIFELMKNNHEALRALVEARVQKEVKKQAAKTEQAFLALKEAMK